MTNVCTTNYWWLLEGEMPKEYCNTFHDPQVLNYTAPSTEMIFNISLEFAVMYAVSLFVVCLFGILMVDWFDRRFIFTVERIMKPIDRRYRFVQNRDREIEFWQGIN